MWYQRARRVMSWQRYLLIGIVGIMVVYAVFGDRLLRSFAPVCPSAPTYHPDVPAELRAKLDLLASTGRLYCVTPPEGLKNLDGPVYWGTDGVNSLLFFQAEPNLTGMGILRYAFGGQYDPSGMGGPPQRGYRPATTGRLAYSNEAPEGSTYYIRTVGAPADTDMAVDVNITGPALQNEGLFQRDFFRDLENLIRILQGQSAAQLEDTTVRAAIPLVPDSWLSQRRRVIVPEFANSEGNPDLAKLREVPAGEPKLFQVLNGPLGSGVWVTGALTDTVPAMKLSPPEGLAFPQEAEPTLWDSTTTPSRLAGFAFPTLEEGTVYEAGYWHDARRAAQAAPDLTFPVVAP